MAVGRDVLAQLAQMLRPLQVRVANSIARAVIQHVDDSKRLQLVQLGVLAGEDVDGAENFQGYGFKSVPLPGAEVVVVFPGGDRAHALVIGTEDRRYRPTSWTAGEVGLYNSAGATVRLKSDGTIEIKDDGAAVALALASELSAVKAAVATALNGIVPSSGAPVTAVVTTGTTKLKGQ